MIWFCCFVSVSSGLVLKHCVQVWKMILGFANVLNRLALKLYHALKHYWSHFATVLNRPILKHERFLCIKKRSFANVSTRIITLPAYRSFRLDYNYFGFTQGSQITLWLYYTLYLCFVNKNCAIFSNNAKFFIDFLQSTLS